MQYVIFLHNYTILLQLPLPSSLYVTLLLLLRLHFGLNLCSIIYFYQLQPNRKAQIRGPEESAYKGYEFRILLDISKDYPISPLTGKFDTKIFHPNVKWDTGEICLDIFKKEWSPAWDIITSCRAIVALLADPAPDRFDRLEMI